MNRKDVSLTILLLFPWAWGCVPVPTEMPLTDPFYTPPAKVSLPPLLERADRILQEALTHPDPPMRSTAAEVVGSTRQLRFLPSLRPLMRDPVVPVRFAAILAIGDTGYTPAHQDLVQIFNETQEDTNVRMAAAYALGRMGAREVRPFYIEQIRSMDQTVRANAALLIGKGGHREAIDQLFWALRDPHSNDRVHMQAADSIARLGDERIMEKLWTRLISSFVDDRIDGIRAMGNLGTRQALEAIQTLLDDPEMEVRLVAAEQLGRAHDTQGKTEVLAIVKDFLKPSRTEDADRRLRILTMGAAAIGAIGSPDLTRYLEPLLKDESPIIQLAAAHALFRIQGLAQPR